VPHADTPPKSHGNRWRIHFESRLARVQFLTGLTSRAATDNYQNSTRSRASFAAISGQTYKTAVAGKSIDGNKAHLTTASFGSFQLAWYPTPPPVISSFSRATGYPGQKMTLSGTNFTGVTRVLINGVPAVFELSTNANFLDLILTAIVLDNVTTGPITIETPHGNFTTSSNFAVLVLPRLSVQVLPGKLVELFWPSTSDSTSNGPTP
jgi:hypothetical protein